MQIPGVVKAVWNHYKRRKWELMWWVIYTVLAVGAMHTIFLVIGTFTPGATELGRARMEGVAMMITVFIVARIATYVVLRARTKNKLNPIPAFTYDSKTGITVYVLAGTPSGSYWNLLDITGRRAEVVGIALGGIENVVDAAVHYADNWPSIETTNESVNRVLAR